MTASAEPKPPRPPSIVDVLARQSLSLATQITALRGALDAMDAQNNAILETVRLLQDAELQRRAAATARAGAEDAAPQLPPVFGRGPQTSSSIPAPPLPPVPPDLARS